jgi:predicted lysophospholipase L1 biosynthesis ABC-type transport system permease subunit
MVLNEPLAVELFGSVERAIGQDVALADVGSEALGVPDHRVVGVVAEDRHYGLVQPHGRAAYVPMSSTPFLEAAITFAVRLTGPGSADVARQLREAFWSVEPDLPLPRVRSMTEMAARATARTRFDAWIFSTFGVIALLLAAAGLYGTLLYSVALDRREMGIRLALGAGRRSVEYRVLRRGLLTAGLGAALGGAGALGATRLLQSRLFEIQPGDPGTLASAVLVLLLTAALACWLPARRAGATDPLETLRQE